MYPGALFAAAGGWQGTRILAGAHLIIWPLLTLIVYDISKPRKIICRDLAIKALIQLLSLAAGAYLLFKERPLAITYAFDKFYVFKHRDFIRSGIAPDTIDLNLMTPKIFYTDLTHLSETTGVNEETIFRLFQLARKNLADRADLYKIFPDTRQEADDVFAHNNLPKYPGHRAGCVTAELVTAFARGIVCFDVEAQRFEEFIRASDLQARQESGN
jgi:hypothetical protein